MLPESIFATAKILIVDDELSNVVLLGYMLRAAGYESVRSTTNSREAMALFEEQPPDLILLDLMMPPPDGFELMHRLGERISRDDCLPILVLTADVTPATKHKALQAGAADFLIKPFDHVEVLLRIRHLLHMRAQHQQLARQKDVLEETVVERTVELRLTCSQLEHALNELRLAQQQMIQQERMSALGSMAAGLAHDFNNALSLILGYSELLQGDLMGTAYEAHSDEFLGTIITAAQDAAKMFNRLRAFYRAQETEDQRAGVDLNALVEQAATLTRPRWHGQALAHGAAIRLAFELAPSLPPLVADASELREMLTNLVFNAVDAMPQGGTLTLRTRHDAAAPLPGPSDADSGALILEVADTGTGMSEDTRCRCLEPFFTTKGDKGTGLGLAMVYGTVQRHEGTIELQSQLGAGTCFVLRLPLRPPGPASEAGPPPGEQPPRRVLVVDDEPIFSGILRRYLTRDGHTADTAADGREALEKFRAAGPAGFDLIITDQGMPGMCGEQLAMQIKALAPSVRVILISGYGGLDDAASAVYPSVDLSLTKPLTQAALRAAIHQVMSASAAPVPSPPRRSERPETRRISTLGTIQSRLNLTHRAA